jgi:hypothetical protein
MKAASGTVLPLDDKSPDRKLGRPCKGGSKKQ